MNAVAIAQEHLAFWLGQEVTASEAWEAMTGKRREHVGWGEVRGFMIGWLLRQDIRQRAA